MSGQGGVSKNYSQTGNDRRNHVVQKTFSNNRSGGRGEQNDAASPENKNADIEEYLNDADQLDSSSNAGSEIKIDNRTENEILAAEQRAFQALKDRAFVLGFTGDKFDDWLDEVADQMLVEGQSPAKWKLLRGNLRERYHHGVTVAANSVTQIRRVSPDVEGAIQKGASIVTKFEHLPELSKGFNFPANGIGKVLFKRTKLVEKLIKTIKLTPRRVSYYCRGPPGNGKSVLSLLIAQTLTNKGDDVYIVKNSRYLDHDCEKYLTELEKSVPEGEKIYLIVDEVSSNPVWTYLLKEAKRIVTIGFGIPSVDGSDFLFSHTVDFTELLLTKEEVCAKDIVNFFLSMMYPIESANKTSGKVVANTKKVLLWLQTYTGGHIFPFVKLAEHIFSTHPHLCRNGNVKELSIVLGKALRGSELQKIVGERCFKLALKDLKAAATVIKLGPNHSNAFDSVISLENRCFWDTRTRWFISKLFMNHLYRSFEVIKPRKLSGMEGYSPIEKCIVQALNSFRHEDFFEENGTSQRYENAIGSLFGFKLASIEAVYVGPQSQVPPIGGRKSQTGGPFPMIDFYINSRIDTFVELTRNGKSLDTHLLKFESESGSYHQHRDKYILLDFELNKIKPTELPSIHATIENPISPLDTLMKKKCYCFVLKTNTLYRGDSVFRRNVSKFLVSPRTVKAGGIRGVSQLSSFSTLCLRKFSSQLPKLLVIL